MKKVLGDFFARILRVLDNKYVIVGGFFVVLALLIIPKKPAIQNIHVGEVAPKTIRAATSMLVEDKAATQEKIREAEANVLPYFEYDSKKFDILISLMDEAFLVFNKKNPDPKKFFSVLHLPVNKELFERILRDGPDKVKRYAEMALRALNGYFVVGSVGVLYRFPHQMIEVISKGSRKTVMLLNKGDVIDVGRAKIIVYNALKNEIPNNSVLRATVWDLISPLITPNLFYDKEATEKAREEAKKRVSPVFFKISKGEVIVREGDIVTPSEYLKLKALNSLSHKGNVITEMLSKLLVFFVFFVGLYYVYRELSKSRKAIKSHVYLLVLETSIIIQLLMFKVFSSISGAVMLSGANFSKFTIMFGMPFTFAAIMVALLVDFTSAFLVAIFISVSTWFFGGSSQMKDFMSLYAFVGSVVGIFAIGREESRFGVIKSGLYISAANLVMVMVYYMYYAKPLSMSLLYDSMFAIFGGIFSVIIVSGFLPIFEFVFNITTDIKLLEMGNLNNPLLKELAIRAPGTYHHSIVVSSLSEAAASAIGANTLVTKVGSYYHDIGKIKRPEYFIENQTEGINPHDKLKPSISALIIINHVKYGVEIAKKHRLGARIIDIIQQHHGTSLIKYFYNKAKEKGENPNEEDFRYKGPKPQTKEAGIVMVADVVEAASKTLSNPTSAHLSEFVRKITEEIFLDGQLDECELTLRDLNLIVESFVKVLVGIYHHRVEYPEQVNGGNGNR